MSISRNAITLLKTRYCHPGESPREVYRRVANALSLGDGKFEKKLNKAMENSYFLPNSPCLRNAGTKKSLLHACFILPISDDMESITETLRNMIIIFKYGGGCFLPDSLITTENDVKYIKDIKIGENVITENGEKHGVLEVMESNYNDVIYNIKLQGTSLIQCTKEHPILSYCPTCKKFTYKKAEELNKDDYVCVPKINDNALIDYNKIDLTPFAHYENKLINKEIELNDKISWLLGLYLAEGWTNIEEKKISFALGTHETKLINKLESIIKDMGYHAWKRTRTSSTEITFSCKALAIFLRENFGENARVKKIPYFILYNRNKNIISSFIRGYLEGDGCILKIRKYNIITCVTASSNLAYQFQLLLVRFGIFIRVRKSIRKEFSKKTGKQLIRYDLSSIKKELFNLLGYENIQTRTNKSYLDLDNCIAIKINTITKQNYNGLVYNLRVLDNNTYLVNNIVVHNCGINFSKLRANGAKLSNGGSSTGVISFMKLFDVATEVVKQGGFRRGALMGILNFEHAEIIEFIRSKLSNQLTNFNISVMVSDKFMEMVEKGENIELKNPQDDSTWSIINAKTIFDVLSFCAWNGGDPGLLFYDRINKDNPLFPKVKIKATNPCSEVGLPEYGACCLGSINLSKFVKNNKFDFSDFEKYIELATRTLLNMNAISWYPLPVITKTMKELNPIGVGIMGFADTLIKLGIKYDSDETLKFIDEISKPYIEITNKIAKDSFYKRIIAPTGSLSILADCSSSIEPVFESSFERHLTIGVIQETRDIYKSKFLRTAHQINPEWHLKIQAKWQEIVDGGISKTINMPWESSVEDVKNIYMQAWKMKTKGITIFREKSKEGVFRKTKCEGDICSL